MFNPMLPNIAEFIEVITPAQKVVSASITAPISYSIKIFTLRTS